MPGEGGGGNIPYPSPACINVIAVRLGHSPSLVVRDGRPACLLPQHDQYVSFHRFDAIRLVAAAFPVLRRRSPFGHSRQCLVAAGRNFGANVSLVRRQISGPVA